jgi:hypothetical protein
MMFLLVPLLENTTFQNCHQSHSSGLFHSFTFPDLLLKEFSEVPLTLLVLS